MSINMGILKENKSVFKTFSVHTDTKSQRFQVPLFLKSVFEKFHFRFPFGIESAENRTTPNYFMLQNIFFFFNQYEASSVHTANAVT